MKTMKLCSALAALPLVAIAGAAAGQSRAPQLDADYAPLRAEYAQLRDLHALQRNLYVQAQAQQAQSAQSAQQAQQAQQSQQKAQRDAQKEAQAQAQAEQRDYQKELEAAREELQRAAREVARLSGQIAGPYVNEVERRFRYFGQRVMLGVGIEDSDRGVRIASVTPNGPGAQAGLVVGDVITKIEGADLTDMRPSGVSKQSPSELLMAQMANVSPGESVKLHVLAESGKERDVVVRAREVSPQVFVNTVPGFTTYSFGKGGPWIFGSNPWSQAQLITLTPGLGSYFGTSKGLLVVKAPDDAALQLKEGDVILDIGGREPTSPEHAMRILGSFEQGEPLKITIMRNKSRQTLDVKLPTSD